MKLWSGIKDIREINVLCVKDENREVWSYVNEYKGKNYFHIREMYKDKGLWKPGKGVSMPLHLREEALNKLTELNRRLAA